MLARLPRVNSQMPRTSPAADRLLADLAGRRTSTMRGRFLGSSQTAATAGATGRGRVEPRRTSSCRASCSGSWHTCRHAFEALQTHGFGEAPHRIACSHWRIPRRCTRLHPASHPSALSSPAPADGPPSTYARLCGGAGGGRGGAADGGAYPQL